MKYTIICFILLLPLVLLWGCKKSNYPDAVISPFVSMYDIRNLYKGQDVTLTIDNMGGSFNITGLVVSDHSGHNLPAGLLILQDSRRLSQTRGIAIPLGDAATGYKPGDSVIIDVTGGILKRVDGILQITGIDASAIRKMSSGNPVPHHHARIDSVLNFPNDYECVLSTITNAGFEPIPTSADVLAGDKTLNDAFGNIILHTEQNATFANEGLHYGGKYEGIVFNTVDAKGQLIPQFRIRTDSDIVVLSTPPTPIIITGFMSDVKGSDGNYEYMQLMATQDIDFSKTPFSAVVTNNAGASTPTGYPANGWATGGMRTFKFNLTSGTAAKGTFFYVGGAGKMINGSGSTSMASSNWIRAFDYTIQNGDGFGNLTGGLFANSGNASGVAIFSDTLVTLTSTPIDCIFIGSSGSLYSAGPPPVGYRVANTDFYHIQDPVSAADQPFFRSGSNNLSFSYNTADLGYFNMLGGVYNTVLGKWTTVRAQKNLLLSKTSLVSDIEGTGATQLQ